MKQPEFAFTLNGLPVHRRNFLTQLASGVFLCTTGIAFADKLFTERGAFADVLARTAPVEEGPFYPDKFPLDTDNDLLLINDNITPAVGQIAHISGRLLDAKGEPIRNAVVEIWQVDNKAVYLKDRPNQSGFDTNFQGFGRCLTGMKGEYYFRTIKPVRYPGRQAPHIHFKVKMKGREDWTTQLYIKGEPGNARDGVYRGIGDAKAKESVTVDFRTIAKSIVGELGANFDIVMGITPNG